MLGILSAKRQDIGIIIDTDFIDEKTSVRQLNTFIEKGIDFTLETTLSDSYIFETIKTARDNDYYIRFYYIAVNTAEESIERIQNRVRKGGHNVPNDIIVERFQHRLDDLLSVLAYCNEAFIYDNENGFVEKAEYGNGRLVIKDNDIPEWLAELKERLTEEAISGNLFNVVYLKFRCFCTEILSESRLLWSVNKKTIAQTPNSIIFLLKSSVSVDFWVYL